MTAVQRDLQRHAGGLSLRALPNPHERAEGTPRVENYIRRPWPSASSASALPPAGLAGGEECQRGPRPLGTGVRDERLSTRLVKTGTGNGGRRACGLDDDVIGCRPGATAPPFGWECFESAPLSTSRGAGVFAAVQHLRGLDLSTPVTPRGTSRAVLSTDHRWRELERDLGRSAAFLSGIHEWHVD